MAHTAQTITKDPSEVLRFTGIPGGTISNQIFPIGRVIYRLNDAITAKGAGDTKEITVQFDLPANFAYVVDKFSMSLSAPSSTTDLVNVTDLSRASAHKDSTVAAPQWQVPSAGEILSDTAGSVKLFSNTECFKDVFFNQSGEAPFLRWKIRDDAAGATGQYFATGYVSVLQFNIEQAINVSVNAPQPVRTT